MEQQPLLCRNGCGFYSNTGTEGLCSVCYKESIKNKQQDPSKSSSSMTAAGAMASLSVDESSNNAAESGKIGLNTGSPTVMAHFPTSPIAVQTDHHLHHHNPESTAELLEPGAPSELSCSATSSTAGDDLSPSSIGKDEKKKKKNKCGVCKKKVGLTGFTCRCDGLFCSIHRYSDKHDCSYDYKELGAEEIRKNNPVIVSQKVNKI